MERIENSQLAVNMLAYEAVIDKATSQANFFNEIKAAGITKIEVRREYIHSEKDFTTIQREASELGIELFYAVPEILFEDKLLPLNQLEGYFKEAQLLGAKQVKFTAGYAADVPLEEIESLRQLLDTYEIENLTLENGQDPTFAKADTFYSFIQELKGKSLPVSVTFDTGNCLYVDEDPLASFTVLEEEISYIHLKDVSKLTLSPTLNGEGDVPTKEILTRVPVTVNVAIEYPLGEHPTETLKKEIVKIS
ncbi:TIM barrel protein [Desemzia sp. RIT804]|uniref:sugar phosphate isomerase/epimerase family protein n=1 Tax=Desemzia sp. RIT 804 TaxID=2810209 RepID=UPI0019518CBF|nr:TIM barrel protein [Desemzia sp. RIT 804]MBM6614736.1 TIM barrel protein [Desemzia sp. RIT 804]